MVIVSGGQSGVDRAALDAAIAKGLPYRGWCPSDGWAEDLTQPPGLLALYPNLQATPNTDPLQRTAWNARDSDALMVLLDGGGLAVSQGTAAGLGFAARHDRPRIVIDLDAEDRFDKARGWLNTLPADIALCIAGPRESQAPGIYAKAVAFLSALFDG